MDDIGKTEDNFGNMVAINNDTVIISARGEDGEGSDEELVQLKNSGAAYVFNRDDSGDTWSQQAKLVGPESSVGDTIQSLNKRQLPRVDAISSRKYQNS